MTCPSRGFTLIEVVVAMLIFAMGVLAMINLSSALGEQMERAALGSLVTVEVQTRVDSLSSAPYAGLVTGADTAVVTLRGETYRSIVAISQYSPLLKEITVTLTPADGTGPARSTTSYVSDRW